MADPLPPSQPIPSIIFSHNPLAPLYISSPFLTLSSHIRSPLPLSLAKSSTPSPFPPSLCWLTTPVGPDLFIMEILFYIIRLFGLATNMWQMPFLAIYPGLGLALEVHWLVAQTNFKKKDVIHTPGIVPLFKLDFLSLNKLNYKLHTHLHAYTLEAACVAVKQAQP